MQNFTYKHSIHQFVHLDFEVSNNGILATWLHCCWYGTQWTKDLIIIQDFFCDKPHVLGA